MSRKTKKVPVLAEEASYKGCPPESKQEKSDGKKNEKGIMKKKIKKAT